MIEDHEMWLPIVYAEFYDIPRAFLVNFHDKSYFFDCAFSESLDDYLNEFVVFQLHKTIALDSATLPWDKLHTQGKRICSISVANVVFDDSKRKSVYRKSVEACLGRKARD